MKLVAFPSRAPRRPRPLRPPGHRLRVIGTLVLVAGIAGAGLLYWFETHNAGPSLEDLMPGTSRANSRLMGVYYGHAGEMMWEWREALARPDAQAGIVLVVAAIVSAGCFRVAWLDMEKVKDMKKMKDMKKKDMKK